VTSKMKQNYSLKATSIVKRREVLDIQVYCILVRDN